VIDEDFCRTIFDDPVARDEQLIVESPRRALGASRIPAPREGRPQRRRHPPRAVPVRRATVEILNEHGYSDGEIAGLVASSAIGVMPGVGE